MARTTLNIDSSVLRELRARSRDEHKSIGEIASQLLARALREKPAKPSSRFSWVSHDLGAPAVDLEDKGALHALM